MSTLSPAWETYADMALVEYSSGKQQASTDASLRKFRKRISSEGQTRWFIYKGVKLIFM